MNLPASRTVIRPIDTVPDFQYLARVPARPDPARVLVVVHGISRNAPFMLRCLAESAEATGYTLLAPVFSQRTYGDYQRLGREGVEAFEAQDRDALAQARGVARLLQQHRELAGGDHHPLRPARREVGPRLRIQLGAFPILA